MSYIAESNHSVNTSVSIADTLGIGGIQLAAITPPGARGCAETPPAPAGHNSGTRQPADDNAAARKAYFAELIADWVANRRQQAVDYMQPNEIGAATRRASLLLRAALDGIAFIHRERIGTDERGNSYLAAVYIVDTIFSDNEHGYSTASARRVAALLGCNEKSVRRARDLLVDNAVLGYAKRLGVEDRYWPIINRKLAAQESNAVWWLDATSEAAKRGRPPEKPRTQAHNPGPKRSGLKENPGPKT